MKMVHEITRPHYKISSKFFKHKCDEKNKKLYMESKHLIL